MNVHDGDFGDDHWLLLVEDSGPNGLGRVLGYLVFQTEGEAKAAEDHTLGWLCELLDVWPVTEAMTTEVMSVRDYRESYGNRMPLRNRYLDPSVR